MEIEEYKARIVDARLESYLRAFGAVCVEGPKWCGKTWTARHSAKSEFLVADPAGNFHNRKLLELDLSAAFTGDAPHLIDEWQEFPELWDATRAFVDQTGKKGRFILTGSSTPNRKGVLHSGVGRIGSVRMHPMSLWESGHSGGQVSFAALCRNEFESGVIQGRKPALGEVAEWIVRGGWPGALGVPTADALEIPREYIRQVMENDIHRIDDMRRDVDKVGLLLRSLARNETTTAGIARLCDDISGVERRQVDPDTVSSYLGALKRLFVTENQLPFHANVRSSVRVKQAEKRHFCDPSLACAILKLTPERVIGDLEFMGLLFEALAVRDIRVYAEGMGAGLYHYQDYSNREIDAVVELPDGDWAAIEVKLGLGAEDAAAASLIAIRDAIATEPKGRPPKSLIVIVGMSGSAYRRKDGVIVCPLSALRP